MNDIQGKRKEKRNILSSDFDANIYSTYSQNQNINYPINNMHLENPMYVNQSIYPGNLSNNDDINEIEDLNECPKCLSYQRKIQEQKLIIKKLQNQLSRYNLSTPSPYGNSPNLLSPINISDIEYQNQVNSLKKNIYDLKKEISEKNTQISHISLEYDEKLNFILSEKAKLEQEISNLKRQNIMLNKEKSKFIKIINSKDDEIANHTKKIKLLINKIKSKNIDIDLLKENLKNMMGNNEYSASSLNYNTLALSSGKPELIRNNNQKEKDGEDSEQSNEENNVVDILYNMTKHTKNQSTGKNINILKSKSQKLYYDSGSENNININSMKKTFLKKEKLSTPKMSSTQSSWMVPQIPSEFHILQRDFENMRKKLNCSIQENQKLKKYIKENVNFNKNINELMKENKDLKNNLNEKINLIRRYQKVLSNKKNDRLKSLLSSKANNNNNNNKIPFAPSSTSSLKRFESQSFKTYSKGKFSSNKIKDFTDYDYDLDLNTNDQDSSFKNLSYKNNSQELIDISDKDETEKRKIFSLKTNKSASTNYLKFDSQKKMPSDYRKDDEINLLKKNLKEKTDLISQLKLSREESTNKLNIANKENNELQKKLESKGKYINELEFKIKNAEKIIEEKNIIQKGKTQDISNIESLLQEKEKTLSQMKQCLSSTENRLNEKEDTIKEKDNIIKEKEENILNLENKIDNLNGELDEKQIKIKKYQEEENKLKEIIKKKDIENNINNSEFIKQRKNYEEKKNQYEKEIELLKLDLVKVQKELKEKETKYNDDKDKSSQEKLNLELKLKKNEG